MLKSLRVPERLFAIGLWLVSLAFAGFLIGLGGRLIGDLPGVQQSVQREDLMNAPVLREARIARDSLNNRLRDLNAQKERNDRMVTAAQNAQQAARTEYDNWIAARTATNDPRQDPEVLRRTRALDTLGNAVRAVEQESEALETAVLEVEQAIQANEQEQRSREAAVETRFQRALFLTELKTFLVRLAITLPLLLLAGWLVLRKRQSEYWPLARGFVLFAVFTFFVELVPYLPSYGGYVRYGVGIIATIVIAHYVVRSMRRYLTQRKLAEQQTEVERRKSLGAETALQRMAMNICPACERPIAVIGGKPSDFCVYCGLRLFDDCPSCATHKNAFFRYCPTCGREEAHDHAATVANTV